MLALSVLAPPKDTKKNSPLYIERLFHEGALDMRR